MEWLSSILAVSTGLILRLAIPIVVTLLVVYTLHRVDVRWQEEAASLPPSLEVEKMRCWEIHDCPAEKMRDCPSYNSAEPCWQTHRLSNGYLREECLNCRVFHQAPIPTPIYP